MHPPSILPRLHHPGLEHPTPAPILERRTGRPTVAARIYPTTPTESRKPAPSRRTSGPPVRKPPPATTAFIPSLFRKRKIALVCRPAYRSAEIQILALKKTLRQQDNKLGMLIEGSIRRHVTLEKGDDWANGCSINSLISHVEYVRVCAKQDSEW